MEPWQQEALRELLLSKRLRPTCRCCGQPIDSDRYLDLEDFGIRAAACEDCVDRNWITRRSYV